MADAPKVKLKTASGVQSVQSKKWIMLGAGALLVVVFFALMSRPSKPPEVQTEPRIDISNEGIGEKSWAVRAQGDVRDAQQRTRKLQEDNDRMARDLAAERQERETDHRDLQALQQQLAGILKNPPPAQAATTPPPANTLPTTTGVPPSTPAGDGRVPPPPPRPWVEGETEKVYREAARTAPGSMPGSTMPVEPAKPRVVEGVTDEELEKAKAEEVAAQTTYTESKYGGFLPAGTFANGALLTGLDAGASETTKANPEPVLIRIAQDGTTAGDSSYQLATCFLIGAGYGDLSSERAYITVNKISCVDAHRGLILEQPLTAYVVDSDGTIGLRGKLIERNGQLIAKSILTGIFSGLGQVASQVNQANASRVVSNGLTGTTNESSVNVNAGSLASAAGFQGISNASNSLSQFFLKQAEAIFPVIFVPAGRKITVVVQDGTSLKWEHYATKFQKVVTPTGG